nr:DUF4347 domain-containing protein [uncultured Oxalicibacterium sp.]
MASKKLASLRGRLTGSSRRSGAPRPSAKRKTLFEALEQRFLLSAELVVPPPPVQQPVLEAPLLINEPGQIQLFLSTQTPPPDASLGNPLAENKTATPAEAGHTSVSLAEPDTTRQAMPGIGIALADFAAHIESLAPAKQLIIVDPSIPHTGTLLDGLLQAMPAGERSPAAEHDTQNPSGETTLAAQLQVIHRGDVDVIVLDARFDGVEQISSILGAYKDLDAIQILSHGSSGSLHLGSTQLDGGNLDQYEDRVASWGKALHAGGDILLYGCDVAQGSYGINFVDSLARLTGADVAASTDRTGAADLGGNWALEYATGQIEASTYSLDVYGYTLDMLVGQDLADDVLTSTSLDVTSGRTGDDVMAGKTGNDTYQFENFFGNDVVTEEVAGGTDTLDFSQVTRDLHFFINADGSIDVVDVLLPLNKVHASNVENLITGSGTNTFYFVGDFNGSVTGTVGGTTVLDYSGYVTSTNLKVDLGAQKVNDKLSFSYINKIIGASSPTVTNTLVSGTGDNVWAITAAGTGKLNELSFERFSVLTGNAAGTDTLDYSAYGSAVTVNLGTGSATGFTSISLFNNIVGSNYADTLIGDALNNVITGGPGADAITGGGGIDTVVEFRDADFVLTDTSLTITVAGVSETDTLTGISKVELHGGDGNNTLDASAVTTMTVLLDGGAGNDILKGGGGANTLSGGLGNDELYGGNGSNLFSGGGGVNKIVGSGTNNSLLELGSNQFTLTDTYLDMAESSVVQTIQRTGTVTAGTFTLKFGEQTTSALAFNATAEQVRSALASLSSIGNNVTVVATTDGWTATFGGKFAGVDVETLVAAAAFTGGGVSISQTKVSEIRRSTISGIQYARLAAGIGNSTLDGSGFSGNLRLDGNIGDDVLIGGSGKNELYGGDGDDTLTIKTNSHDVTIAGGGGVDTLIVTRDANMTLTNTSLTVGSDVFAISGIERATLTGGVSANTLDASTFTGLSIDTPLDFLNNGSGIFAEKETEFGFTITMSNGTKVNVDVSKAYSINDVLKAIHTANAKLTAVLNAAGKIVITDTAGGSSALVVENNQVKQQGGQSTSATGLGLIGGTANATSYTGHALVGGGYVTLDGGAGDDTLIGSAGNDFLTGGTGKNTIDGKGGTDTLVEQRDANMTLTNGKLTIVADTDESTLTSIENAILKGGASANIIDASAFDVGNVTFYSNGGKDDLRGGKKVNTFYVDVAGLNAGDKVKVSAGTSADNIYILGAGDLTSADLSWIDMSAGATTATLVFKGETGTVGSNLDTAGQNIAFEYDSFTLNGYTVSTGGSQAGNITITARTIDIANGKLLAVSSDTTNANGDIQLVAQDLIKDFTGTGFANIDINSASVNITKSEIKGGNVTVTAKAIAQKYDLEFGDSWLGRSFAKAVSKLLGAMEGNLSIIAGVSLATSRATINIDKDTVITATNDFTAYATATAVAVPKTNGFGLGVVVGIADTTAIVTVAGTINATGNITLMSSADNTSDVVSQPKAVKGYDVALAVNVVNSESTAQATGTSRLTSGGAIAVKAETIDRTRTLSESVSPEDGKVAMAFAVAVENGSTHAYLDGYAKATGDIEVEAEATQEEIQRAKFFNMVPNSVSGVSASAGVGSKSTGDLLTDLEKSIKGAGVDKAKETKLGQKATALGDKAKDYVMGIAKKSEWLKKKIEEPASNKWDIGAGFAVAIDINDVQARIGDGAATLAAAEVEAGGDISVSALVESRPSVSASSSIENEATKPETIGTNAKWGASVSIAVGVYSDTAQAIINGDAQVDARGALKVEGKTINQIDPDSLWGVNLVKSFNKDSTTPKFLSTDGSKEVARGDKVEVKQGHSAGGDVGNWYEFVGATLPGAIDLSKVDYTDTTQWRDLGSPSMAIGKNFVSNVAGYLNDNLMDNLIDTWSNSTAEGQVSPGAGALSVLVLDHDAEASIKNGAKINQKSSQRSGNQTIEVNAASIANLVSIVGNLKTPGISGATEFKNWSKDDIISKPGGGVSAEGGTAVGASMGFYVFDNDVKATIEDGVTLYGDNLSVTASNDVISAVFGASGSSGGAKAGNGVLVANVVLNDTLAQVGNNAAISLGSKPLSSTDPSSAVAYVSALDRTYVVTVAGAVATGENTGVGISIAGNVIQRDTQAVIGSLLGATGAAGGSFAASGKLNVQAQNSGVIVSLAAAGGKAGSKPAQTPADSTPSTPPVNGTGGTQGADGTAQSQADLESWQTKMQAVLKDLNKTNEQTKEATEEPAKAQGSTAVSGAVTVNIVYDNTRAYINKLGSLTATDIKIDAGDNTMVASLAGSVAFAKAQDESQSAKALAGAFGINFFGGYTQAFLDYVTTLDASSVSIAAARTGWIAALAAGVSGATGNSGTAIAGSVSVNVTAKETQAKFGHVGGSVTGLISVDAQDDNNIVSVAGAAAYGGKSGFGVGIGVNVMANNTSALVDSAVMTKTGGYKVTSDSDAMIISVAASAGIGKGGTGGQGAAVGGTISVNVIDNSSTAKILNSTSPTGSTGDITVSARDGSQIYAFAGGFAFGKTKAFGVAAGVNAISNNTLAAIESSTLYGTGKATISAKEEATIMSFAIGGAGSDKSTVAGSIGINAIINSIDAHVKGSSLYLAGAIAVAAQDKSTLVSLAGAVGVSTTEKGVGVAIGWNRVSNGITAYINSSTVSSTNGAVDVTARSNALLVGIGAAGGGGKSTSGAGTLQINSIANQIDAHINNGSNVTAKGNVSVIASEAAALYSAALAVGVSTEGSAIGAVLSYNYVGTTANMADPNAISVADAPSTSDADGSKNVSVTGTGTVTAAGVTAYIDSSAVAADASVIVLAGFDDPNKSLESSPLLAGIKTVNPSTVVTTTNGTIGLTAHGYKTGDAVVYNKGVAGNTAISGLTSGTTYYVIVVDANTLKLATTQENALANQGIALANVGTGSDHSLTPYVAPAADPVVKTFDPSGTVDLTQTTRDTFLFTNAHGLSTGDQVVYNNGGGSNISNLTSGSTYYVIKIDDTSFKLATSAANATAGTAIALTSVGSGNEHKLTRAGTTPLVLTFAPSQALDTTAHASGKINFGSAHGYVTGDEIKYTHGTGTNIGGLAENTSYYVIKIDDNTIKLATSKANAVAGIGIELTSRGTGTGHKLTQVVAAVTAPVTKTFNPITAVTVSTNLSDTISFGTAHNLNTGDAFVYRKGAEGNTAIGGLVDGETYYVIKVDATHIRVASTYADATGTTAKVIALTGKGTGTDHSLVVKKSQVNAAGIAVALPQTIGSQITSVTIAGAGGKNASGAGAVSLNFVRMNVSAYISNTGSVNGTARAVTAGSGDVIVMARDISQVNSGTGSLGISVGSGTAVNASIGLNDVRNNVTAQISGAKVVATAGDVTVSAEESARVINVVIGGAASSEGGAIGGSLAVNMIGNSVSAAIKAGTVGGVTTASDVTAQGDVAVLAKDTASIATLAGNISASFSGKFGVGLALAVNSIQDSVSALIDNSSVKTTTGNITVDATFAKPTTLPTGLDVQIAAMAVSGGGAQSVAGAGSVALNWVRNSVTAKIANIGDGRQVKAGGKLSVLASDNSTINSLAGAVAISGIGASGGSGAIGASVAYNYLGGDPNDPTTTNNNIVRASIENVTGTGKVEAVSLEIGSLYNGQINNITVAGAAAGTFALGGSVSINRIRNTSEAYVLNAASVTTTGTAADSISLHAKDTSTIRVLAGGIGLAIAKEGGAGIAAGVSVASNVVENKVGTYIDNAKVTSAGGIKLDAREQADIEALTIGVAVGVSTGGGGFAGSGAGAGSGNTVKNTVSSVIRNSLAADSKGVAANGGALSITAADEATILAGAGSLAFSGSFGGGGVGGSIGISVAVNKITDSVEAAIDSATVSAAGNLSLTATEDADIRALTVGGAVGVSGGGGGAGVGAAGAGSGNTIRNTVLAAIRNASSVTTTNSGSVSLTATDSSFISANAGGLGIGVAFGGGGAGVSLGVAAADNNIQNSVSAYIDNSLVTSAGGVSLSAMQTATIESLSIGGAVAVQAGGGGAAVAAAGAGSNNTIKNTIAAYVNNSLGSTKGIRASGAIALTASDDATITANAGGVGIAIMGGGAGAGVSMGIAAATNVIENTVDAYFDKATVSTTANNISLSATESASIAALTLGGAIAGSGGGAAGVGVGLAGAGSGNTVKNKARARFLNGSDVKTITSGNIALTASDTSEIRANAGGVGIAVGGAGAAGVGVSMGVAFANNKITNGVEASIDSSTVAAAGTLSLSATSNATIEALSIGGAVAASGGGAAGVSVAAAGSGSYNEILNTVSASIKNSNGTKSVSASGISLSASDSSTIRAYGGGLAVAGSGGGAAGVGVSLGIAAATNKIGNTIDATIDNADVTSTAGNLSLSAVSGATVEAITVGGAIAGTGGGAAGVGVGAAGAGSGNEIANTVKAVVRNNAVVKTVTSGNMSLSASDTSTITANAGGVGIAAAGGGAAGVGVSMGVAVADNKISNSVSAYIDGASADSAGTLGLSATGNATIKAISIGGALAGSGGGAAGVSVAAAGAGSNNQINNTIAAYIKDSNGSKSVSARGLSLTASDTSTIVANGGGIGIAAAGGGAAGVGVTVGISAATNKIGNLGTDGNVVQAYIDNSVVNVTSANLSLSATSTANIKAMTIGGAVAVGGGGAAGVGVGAAGAGSSNEIKNTIKASIGNNSVVKTITSGNMSLTATDNATINADGGGLSLAVGGAGAAGVGAALGVAVSINKIENTVAAQIDTSEVRSAGSLSLSATESATITSYSVGGALAVGGGLVGVGVAGAGADSRNTIKNTVQATINGTMGGSKEVTAAGAISLSATDTSSILANAGGLAAGIGGGGVGASGAVGAAVAINTITNTVQAAIIGSKVTATGGNISLSATETATINATSAGGAVALAGGAAAAAAAGAGGEATTTISNIVEAYISGSSDVKTVTSGNISLTATDTANVTADTIAAAVSIAGGLSAGTFSVGAAVAQNTVTNRVRAYSDASTLTSAGSLSLTASSTPTISAKSIAASVAVAAAPTGVAFSGAGAQSKNTVNNTIATFIAGASSSAKSTTKAAGDISLSASETARITAQIGSASVAGGVVGGSIGASVADNSVTSSIKSYAENANVTSTTGAISLSTSSDDQVSTLTYATAVAAAIGGAGAGASATSSVNPTLESYAGRDRKSVV